MTDDGLIGRTIAQKYSVIRLLGRGGMGAVYEARNHLGKRFAVKVLLKPELVHDTALATRFFREAKAAAGIESKHIVEVYDSGVDPETSYPFIIMEYLSGEDLDQLGRRLGPINPTAVARILSQAAAGLAKAHEAGIVHRDIKPANIFVAEDDGDSIIKVLDFGIAKQSLEGFSESGDHALTQSGTLVGTPLYMSPEQAQGLKTVDARTDVWSLGMCLYQGLSGRVPYDDIDTIGKLIVAVVSRELTPVQTFAPWVSDGLAAVVHRALTRDVAARFQTARELMQALRPYCGESLAITRELLVPAGSSGESGAYVASPVATPASFDETLPASADSLRKVQTTTSATSVRSAEPTTRSGARRRLLVGGSAIALLSAGGIAAVMMLGGRGTPAPKAAVEAPVSAPLASIAPASSSAVPHDVPAIKTASLKVVLPPKAILKVGLEDWTSKVKDGRVELSGPPNTEFRIQILQDKKQLLVQKHLLLDDGVIDPDEINPGKGEQVGSKLVPKGKASAAPAETTKEPPAASPPTTKTKPAIDTTPE